MFEHIMLFALVGVCIILGFALGWFMNDINAEVGNDN